MRPSSPFFFHRDDSESLSSSSSFVYDDDNDGDDSYLSDDDDDGSEDDNNGDDDLDYYDDDNDEEEDFYTESNMEGPKRTNEQFMTQTQNRFVPLETLMTEDISREAFHTSALSAFNAVHIMDVKDPSKITKIDIYGELYMATAEC